MQSRIEGKCKCGSCSYDQADEFWQFVWMHGMHPATRIIRCPNCGDGLLDGGIARPTVVVPEKPLIIDMARDTSGLSYFFKPVQMAIPIDAEDACEEGNDESHKD